MISVAAEAVLQATHDYSADFLANTQVAFSAVLGATAGNIFTFAAPHMQLIDPHTDGDRDGLQTDELHFMCETGGTLDDEFSIVMT